jgi:hypothetical protein
VVAREKNMSGIDEILGFGKSYPAADDRAS